MADDHGIWTLEAVKEHLETIIAINDEKYGTRFDAMEKQTQQSMKSAEQAVLKAESAAEKRFESVNEFRNTLSDQQHNLMPRSEVGVMMDGLNQKVYGLEKQIDALIAERVGVKGGWGYAAGVIGIVVAIVALMMTVFKVGP